MRATILLQAGMLCAIVWGMLSGTRGLPGVRALRPFLCDNIESLDLSSHVCILGHALLQEADKLH